MDASTTGGGGLANKPTRLNAIQILKYKFIVVVEA